MYKFIICFFFISCAISSWSQSNIDSLYQKLNNELEKKEEVEIFAELALAYRTTSPDSVSKYANLALANAQKENNSLLLAKSYRVVGLSNSLLSKTDSALLYYKKALEILPPEINKKLEADIRMGIGSGYYYLSHLDKAVEMFISAASTYEELGEVKRSAPAYSNIGMILNANNQDEKAQIYFHKALQLADQYNLMGTKLPVLVNLGTLFLKNEENDSAIYYANRCYETSKKNSMSYGMARALIILSEAYSNKGMFERGLSSSKEGAILFKEMGNQKLLRSMQYKEAIALKGLHKYKQALKIALQVLRKVEKDESLKEFLYLFIHDTYLELGDIDNALKYYKLYVEEYKKTELKHHQNTVLELETKYETEKKSIEIQALTDKAKIQELKITQQRWLIGGAVFSFGAIILLVVLYNNQNTLKKQNEMLSLEQRFLRFQMNPHFIFNALGAIQKFVLERNPIEGASFIAKFSSLIRQVLEHSREEYITIAQEVDSITNYLDLQKLRFENKFDYLIEMDDNLDQDETYIPPMFAQPFIENALEHGISTLDKKGKITVTFAKSLEAVRLTIIDNGIGLDSLATQAKEHISLATTITNERINKIGNLVNNVNLTIKNIHDDKGNISGVKVSLLLPSK